MLFRADRKHLRNVKKTHKKTENKTKHTFQPCLFIWVTSFSEALILTQYTAKYFGKRFSHNEMTLKCIKNDSFLGTFRNNMEELRNKCLLSFSFHSSPCMTYYNLGFHGKKLNLLKAP